MDSTIKARNIVIKMLKKRGYEIEQFESDEIKPFVTQRITQKTNEHSENYEKIEKIIVFFSQEPKIGITQIREFIEIMKLSSENDDINTAILVLKGTVSSSAKKATMNNKSFTIEIFHESELQFDITEHELQPKFTVLKPEEKEKLLIAYTAKPTQIPRMLSTDPIARYYGVKKGTVFKIERQSETAGMYLNYRIVI